MKRKMNTKDLIFAGAFGAIYLVVVLVCVVALAAVPVLYLMAPLFVGLVGATVYLLCVTRIRKPGAILILGVLFILLACTSSPYAMAWAAVAAIAAELIARAGSYESMKLFRLSYVVFNLNMVGPFLMLVFAKDQFLSIAANYYGQEYVQTLQTLVPDWILAALVVEAVVGALVGAFIAAKLFKKHFERDGIA